MTRVGEHHVTIDCRTVRFLRDFDDAFLVERPADEPGDEKDHHRPDFQKSSEDRAAAGIGEVLCGKGALNNVLVSYTSTRFR